MIFVKQIAVTQAANIWKLFMLMKVFGTQCLIFGLIHPLVCNVNCLKPHHTNFARIKYSNYDNSCVSIIFDTRFWCIPQLKKKILFDYRCLIMEMEWSIPIDDHRVRRRILWRGVFSSCIFLISGIAGIVFMKFFLSPVHLVDICDNNEYENSIIHFARFHERRYHKNHVHEWKI